MTLFYGVSALDQTRIAKIKLMEHIQQIASVEDSEREQLSRVANSVKKMDKTKMHSALKGALIKSKKIRQQLDINSKKREALEQHLDSLSTTELNQSIFSAMQTTSAALKSMGASADNMDNVDTVMLDLEDRFNDISSVQNALSSSLTAADDNLEDELALLLGEDEISLPTQVNNMEQTPSNMPASTPSEQNDNAEADDISLPPQVDNTGTTPSDTSSTTLSTKNGISDAKHEEHAEKVEIPLS